PAASLAIQTQPTTVTAGVTFSPAPAVRILDAFGNLATTSSAVVTATLNLGTAVLQGTTSVPTVNGVATFANLSYSKAETITIDFPSGTLTGATSGSIVVGPAAAAQLVFTTLPGGVSRTGSPLATQPVVKSVDQFGNTSAVGLPANFNVALALTGGSGSLLGATGLDIGSAAGNGTVAFTGVQCGAAGDNKQITASAVGLTSAVTAPFFVGGLEPATGRE